MDEIAFRRAFFHFGRLLTVLAESEADYDEVLEIAKKILLVLGKVPIIDAPFTPPAPDAPPGHVEALFCL